MQTASDEYYMARAIALAEIAVGRTSPNPTVGCVIVREGEVVGEGYHPGPGQPHAEVFALRAAAGDARGATVFVTLEPCSTEGRTPPCTEALLEAGVSAVVYGTLDPNPDHQGRGIALLNEAGIETRQAGDQAFLRDLNRGFFCWMERGRPYVSAKIASTLDGRLTFARGSRSALTGGEAQAWAHRWRASADAVLIGVGTALIDDPLLTARPAEGCARQPTRVVVDSKGRLPLTSQLVKTAGRVPVLVLTTSASDPAWADDLKAASAQVVTVADRGGLVDISAALRTLGARGILEVAVEPGAQLLASLVEVGLLDEVNLILTPWVGGAADAPRWFDDLHFGDTGGGPRDAHAPERWEIAGSSRLGPDLLVTVKSEAWS
jgi:diaminohydroxyphosphoribosylaminopyrimidine deaminase / 5-amino-6-(5-phosphoribosylamino)uracil reductase